MTGQHPRTMTDWMRIQERSNVTLRGMASTIRSSVDVVKEEIQQISGRQPTHPIELVYQTAYYTDTTGRSRIRFLLDFPDVTKGTDGDDIAIESYQLWGRDISVSLLVRTTSAVAGGAAPGLTIPGLARTPSARAAEEARIRPWALLSTSPDSGFRADDFEPGTLWEFKARAIGVRTTEPGRFSATVTVQMDKDTTPPPQPTAPVITVERGTITARWDGQSVLGPMPGDFKYAVLAHGTASSPTMEIARFGRSGGFKVVADIDYYDPQFFRIQAVDESGNRSPWSEQGVGYTTPLVDRDVILSTLDAAKTHLINIDAGVSILPDTIITEHLVVTEEMTAKLANFLHVRADMLEANEIWSDTVWFGLADGKLVRADMFEGKEFFGGVFTTTAGGQFRTSVEEYRGIKFDDNGILAYSSAGGVETFRLDAATGNLTANYGTLTGLKYQTHAAPSTGIKIDASAGIQSYNGNNQLNFSLSAAGATFTGRVTSGFGAAKAVLTDAVYQGRPGVQIVTGSGYYFEPFMVSYSDASTDEAYKGALYLSAGAKTAASQPAQLLLSENGAFRLAGFGGSIDNAGWGQYSLDLQSGGAAMHVGNTSAFLQGPGGAVMQANDQGEVIMIASGAQCYVETTNGGTSINGGLTVYGAKNFVMDHPLLEGMQLLHGSTESPVSGVEYWGSGVVGASGEDVFELPEYFEALAKPEGREVFVTGKGEVRDWSDVIDGRVTVYGNPGTKYSWLVKAERFGGDFEVERETPTPPDTRHLIGAKSSNALLGE